MEEVGIQTESIQEKLEEGKTERKESGKDEESEDIEKRFRGRDKIREK